MDKFEVISMDRLVKIYLKIRSAESELTKDYDSKLAELKEERKIVANSIKDQMKAAGDIKSLRTPSGTVVLTTKTLYWTQDWDAFKEFVMQHNAVDLLERRIAQTNMTKFLEANPGAVPPGLNADSEIVVSVRKPS